MLDPIIGDIDLTLIALYSFWLFFALLIYYLQTENMREGYPLEDDAGKLSANQGVFPLPKPKTFILPHGRGTRSVPDRFSERENLALKPTNFAGGFPYEPTGDPLVDGVGPASWANRRDVPELDGKGHPKIIPMAAAREFHVTAGRDPRGSDVLSDDAAVVGKVTDMWIDEPEQVVRYIEFELDPAHGHGRRLVPIQLAVIRKGRVIIRSLLAKHFANVPQIKSPNQITLLEEDKVTAYYGGGTLYATQRRLDPQLGA